MENDVEPIQPVLPLSGPVLHALLQQKIEYLRIGERWLELGTLKVLDGDKESRKLTPKSVAVLLELALRAGETVARDDLLEKVWPDTMPTPEVLTQAIKELRKALDVKDSHAEGELLSIIETVPKLGYRLLATPSWFARKVTSERMAAGHVSDSARELSTAKPNVRTESLALKWLRTPLLIMAIALLVAVGLIALAPPPAPNSTADPALQPVLPMVRKLSSHPGVEATPTISADGQWLAYTRFIDGIDRVYVRDLKSPDAQRLTSDSDSACWEEQPQFAPHALEIAYFRVCKNAQGSYVATLLAKRIVGDSPRELLTWQASNPRRYHWYTEHEIVYTHATEVSAVATDIVAIDPRTRAQRILVASKNDYFSHPRMSPDHTRIAARRGFGSGSDLVVIELTNQKRQRLSALGDSGFDWLPSGKALVVAEFNDEAYRLQRLGLDGSRVDLGVRGFSPRVANTGLVVFRSDQNRENLLEYRLDKTDQKPEPRFASSALDQIPELSPDGTHVAFLSSRGGFDQVWFGALDQPEAAPIAVTERPGRIGRLEWFTEDLPGQSANNNAGYSLVFPQSAPGAQSAHLWRYRITTRVLSKIDTPPNLGLIIRATQTPDGVLLLTHKDATRTLSKFKTSADLALPWRLQWQHPQVMTYKMDPYTQALYFTRVGSDQLYRYDGGQQNTARVTKANTTVFLWSWYVYDSVLFRTDVQGSATRLLRHDLLSQQTEIVRDLGTDYVSDFALDRGLIRLLTSQAVISEADISSVHVD
jgi:DNA-binding winged helix-turn-helix (wHTH) protein/Tol biopolymer transport system component